MKDHVKKAFRINKLNYSNFKYMRSYLTTEAAKVFLHSMVFSHLIYSLTTWSQTNTTILKPLQSLFKNVLKMRNKKPLQYHYYLILNKYMLDLKK